MAMYMSSHRLTLGIIPLNTKSHKYNVYFQILSAVYTFYLLFIEGL